MGKDDPNHYYSTNKEICGSLKRWLTSGTGRSALGPSKDFLHSSIPGPGSEISSNTSSSDTPSTSAANSRPTSSSSKNDSDPRTAGTRGDDSRNNSDSGWVATVDSSILVAHHSSLSEAATLPTLQPYAQSLPSYTITR
ncbi:MAG: hypothetical protein Q9217_002958 [Psora testacea]